MCIASFFTHTKQCCFFHSTISSLISAISTVVLQDVVKACKPNISDSAATKASKVICVCVGAVSLLLVVVAKYLGSGLFTVRSTILTYGINSNNDNTLMILKGSLTLGFTQRCLSAGDVVYV